MPTGGHGDDVGTAAVTGAAAGPDALAPLADDQHALKVFENLGMQDFIPDKVARVGDLLKLRSYVLT
jgi:hypothetical protein